MTRCLGPVRAATILSTALLLVLASAACGGASEESVDTAGDGTAEVVGGVVEITAADLAFDATTIVAPAGEAFSTTLVNDDSAPHNLSVYVEEGGTAVVRGDVISGGQTTTVEIPPLDAGEYFFVCDLHTNMTGTVVVGGG